MADYFCDHGAYSSALGTTPTWGVPQEGDGSTKDAATASSVASIAFASVPTSGALSVCGITIGTTGVIGAATVGAAADALAGLINAVDTTVAAGVAVGTPQLRNLVYARGPTGGAPAGTCQIMMRVGSTALNQATNSNAAIANTFDGSPTLVQFVGGTGGCWGWLINTAAIGVSSSIAIVTYGLLVSKPMVTSSASQALPVFLDIVWARANKVLSMGANSLSRATCGYSMRLLVDSNIKWTGDPATGNIVDIQFTPTATTNCYPLNEAQNGFWGAVNQKGLRISMLGSAASATLQMFYHFLSASAEFIFENVELYEAATVPSTSKIAVFNNLLSTAPHKFNNVDLTFLGATATLKGGTFISFPAGQTMSLEVNGGTWYQNVTGGADPGPVLAMGTPNFSGSAYLKMNGVHFSGWSSPFRIMSSSHSAGSFGAGNFRVTIENCTGANLETAVGNLSTSYPRMAAETSTLLVSSADVGKSFRHENLTGVADWVATASPAYPYLSAVMDDGTAYSMRVLWFNLNKGCKGFRTPKLRQKNRLASGARTIKLELFYRSALALDMTNAIVHVTYVNTSNQSVHESTLGRSSMLASSSATWTNAGSYSGFASYKVELLTSQAIKTGTLVVVEVEFPSTTPSGATESIYIDPEFTLT